MLGTERRSYECEPSPHRVRQYFSQNRFLRCPSLHSQTVHIPRYHCLHRPPHVHPLRAPFKSTSVATRIRARQSRILKAKADFMSILPLCFLRRCQLLHQVCRHHQNPYPGRRNFSSSKPQNCRQKHSICNTVSEHTRPFHTRNL